MLLRFPDAVQRAALLRRAGIVQSAGARNGPGSAAHRYASAEPVLGPRKARTRVRCAASGARVRDSLWLPDCNECGSNATPHEHLAQKPAGSCMRRYLATPLHEIIPSLG